MCYYCFQGCDDFTHNFLRKLGVRIRNPENIPTDPYTDHRKKVCFKSDLNWGMPYKHALIQNTLFLILHCNRLVVSK